ncbi:methyltransferase TYW3-domain-containing protein [Talaromyces proteolyticus]|uniref:tRNA(Phe) 7-[(3-amino-3-carboxypropyl)-4-demethylwyosine(37)-N(4)]-methyltransferase n=1 Tax=Talaromyces proteolyticus TaxID=1131652 RepID=A0AAD4PYQ9_9EURO|nr:methyltransferase TYW3-domain-containing protein [Talaromyces proteolyticus]KAH8695067.1 methyltransferase TYW3-domain-containing protein [Talaromyces proteolyticus]
MQPIAAIPPSFIARKSKILSDLSVPDAEYTDLSPKGSVDEGIRDLIRDINNLDGLVTTSSCAGRTSVFVEGSKTSKRRKLTSVKPSDDDDDGTAKRDEEEEEAEPVDDRTARQEQSESRKFAVSGGKGEGRWLYVSHDPVSLYAAGQDASYHKLFGLVPGDGIPKTSTAGNDGICLVRFHYDPMILHVMTATLHHAQPVLTAASSAGFRESGLQSLRCLEATLDTPSQSSADSHTPSPIVAVRSSGLSLESVIGYYEDKEDEDAEPVIRSLVTEEYLQMLVALANERFVVNTERVERFRTRLLDLYTSASSPTTSGRTKKPPGWEDPQVRREKKKAEGLRRKAEAARRKASEEVDNLEVDIDITF